MDSVNSSISQLIELFTCTARISIFVTMSPSFVDCMDIDIDIN